MDFHRSKYLMMVTEVNAVTNIDDKGKYEMWKEKVNKVLKEAKEKHKKSRDAMVARYLSKNPPLVYQIGKQVLTKLPISDKKIRGKKKTFDIVKGEIVDRDTNRYKVKYMNKLKSVKMDWFSVSVITSETRNLKRKKQRLVKVKNVK